MVSTQLLTDDPLRLLAICLVFQAAYHIVEALGRVRDITKSFETFTQGLVNSDARDLELQIKLLLW